jgi:NADH-quinone oxidoreductase subunit A
MWRNSHEFRYDLKPTVYAKMSEYIGIAVAFVLAGVITFTMIALASTLGRKKPSTVKSEPFECGKNPFSVPGGKLAIKFYLTAILFILFDVELLFLYPWAVIYRQAEFQMTGLVEMIIFLGVLMVGYIYAWDNGALNWQ